MGMLPGEIYQSSINAHREVSPENGESVLLYSDPNRKWGGATQGKERFLVK